MEHFVTLSPGQADSIAINSRSLVTFSARKYLRLCWREGWGELTSLFKHLLEYTYFSRLVKRSLLGYYNHFYVFLDLFIYFYSLKIFVPLLVFSLPRYLLLVTALLCLVTPDRSE